MKKILNLIAGLVLTFHLSGQVPTFQWANKIAPTVSTNSAHVTALAADQAGNVYTTGWFTGTTNFGGINKTNSGIKYDFFIAKYTSNGTIIWVNTFGSATKDEVGVDIKVDNNALYICGTSAGSSFDFDPGAGTFTLVSSSTGFTAKYDQNGNFFWAKANGGYPSSLDLDKFGNVFVTGVGSSAANYFVEKYDNSGTNLGGVGGSGAIGFNEGRVKTDSTGNVYVVFGFSGTISFSTFTLTSSGSSDYGVVKYSNTFSHLWSKKIGGAGGDWSPSVFVGGTRPFVGITVDNQQNLCLSGLFTSVVNFGPTTFTSVNGSGGDGFFAKYNGSNGNLVFAKQLEGSGVQSVRCGEILVDQNNFIHINGYVIGSVDCDPGPATAVLNISTGRGMFYAKYDINGNYISNGLVGSATTSNVLYPAGMFLTSSSLYINGCFFGTEDFDMSAGTNNLTASTSNSSGYFAKYNYCSAAPSSPGLINGTTSFCSGAGVQNYSITAIGGATSYTWSLPSGWSGTSSTNSIAAVTGTAGGNISVTAGNACGTSSAAVLSITVNPNPSITVNSGSICSGSSFTIVPSGAITYTFSSGSAVVSPTTNTSYSVSGTSMEGCVSSSVAVSNVTVVANPTANASSSQTITCSSSSVTLNGSGISTYTWSGPGIISGGNTSSPVVNMAGTYSLVGSTSGCNSNTATVIVSSNTIAPTVTAASSATLICGPPFQGTATITASGASTYSWNTSATTNSISVSPGTTTTYTVIGTAANGCTNVATFTQNVSACTGLEQLVIGSSEFVVYPNPTSGLIVIDGEIGVGIEIYNSLGEIIYKTKLTEEKLEIDLSEQSAGVYFIRYESIVKKLIRQ